MAATLGDNIAAAANKNGVKKIVFNTSCFVADKDNDNPAHDGRRDIEQAIINSETAYAIFEPKVFMDNLIRSWNKPAIVNQGIFAYPAKPDLLISWICLDDVAAYMVEALTRDDIPSGRYAIGGPEALVGDPDDFSHASDELSHLQWIPLAEVRNFNLPFITEVVLAEVSAALPALDAPASVPFFKNTEEESLFHRLGGVSPLARTAL